MSDAIAPQLAEIIAPAGAGLMVAADLRFEVLHMTAFVNPPAMASPCNKICTLEPVSALCIGCGRSLAEIAGWIGYDDAERARIIAELPQRLAAMPAAAVPAPRA